MADDRATVDVMEQRLLAWVAWLKGGAASSGYPTKSVLHESWMPPSPGMMPTMGTAPASSDERHRAMHADILSLSVRLQNTLVVVYLDRAGVAEQVLRLECQASTVRSRVMEAKRLLALMASRRVA